MTPTTPAPSPGGRAPVSIIILAWNAWKMTEQCLETLRPTLSADDQVIVVDNGSTDETPARLRRYRWLEVVTNAQNRGFAGGCNDGAVRARNSVLVFLNNDTILAPGWLEPLIAPFDDPIVAATGPRSNLVSGPQVVSRADGVDKRPYTDLPGLTAFSQGWAADHAGELTETLRLVGFCLAIRRDAFTRAGGFDERYTLGGHEDDELCWRLHEAGWRLLIAHGSYVHHEGHKTFDENKLDWFGQQGQNFDRFEDRLRATLDDERPLLSACVHVRGESEEVVAACVASLEEIADEIVLSGASAEVASAVAGTRPIRCASSSDAHAPARAAAIETARGAWLLLLDADQQLACEAPLELRRQLAAADARFVALTLVAREELGAETLEHALTVLIRPRAAQVTGAITEEIVGTDARPVAPTPITGLSLRRKWFLRDADALTLTRLAVLEQRAGRAGDALLHSRTALETAREPALRRLALRCAAEAAIGCGELKVARELLDEHATVSAPARVGVLAAAYHLHAGDLDRARRSLKESGSAPIDEDGLPVERLALRIELSDRLAAAGRPAEAADLLLEALDERAVVEGKLAALIDRQLASGRGLENIVRAIRPEHLKLVFQCAVRLESAHAAALLEASLAASEHQALVLAAGAEVAKRLPIEAALVWSARLRGAGFSSACPLVAIASGDRSFVERARAAATAYRAFGDERGKTLLVGILTDAPSWRRELLAAEARLLCPDVVADLAAPQPLPAPRVTVVIPCWNKVELTVPCLDALERHTPEALYEVVIVDNGSTDETRHFAGLANDRFRYVRNEENRGFGPACNQGAALARGEFVLFLNNDTEVRAGWLEALLETMDAEPDIGALQPQLLFPDGRVNDAGGLVFAGGAAWNYGKGHPFPDAPLLACRRDVDYASGACLLVRRSAFEAVGGFDDRYAPAYYEDTDLSFALRASGWRTVYEPAAQVVHVEGGTAGTDVASGIKAYQTRNATLFADKWAEELSTRPELDPSIVDRWAHRPRAGGGQYILVLEPDLPMHDRASGSLRLFTLLRCLSEAGHSVFFYALGAGGDQRYARELGRFGAVCYGGDPALVRERGAFYGAVQRPRLGALLEAFAFDTVIASPWRSAADVIELVRETLPEALFIADTNDVHFVRLEREAALAGAPSLVERAAVAKREELELYARCDRVVCVTEEDARVVRAELADIDIAIVPNAHGELDPGPGFAERSGIVFVGNFNHPPNGDAVRWWQEEIAGPLATILPGVPLTVVGNDPAGYAASLADARTTVVGTVESTLPYLHAARVSVAPLRYGAGMKGKVGEALAAGTPVVGTSIAVEGMSLVGGEHALVADDPVDFASAVARLHEDEVLWKHLREQGRRHVARRFGIDTMRQSLADLLAPRASMARGAVRDVDDAPRAESIPEGVRPARRARTVALYLPQFHPTPENDAAWGPGFTEWHNVVRAMPRFSGHEQPHLPADLGFYDLRLAEARNAQAALARRSGVDGFCYYHYWFEGRRLLHEPLDAVLSSASPDFPFMLCWANEDWRANWDGQSGTILQAQTYSEDDDQRHAEFLATVFADGRYIRVEGRPVFAIYRPASLPDAARTAAVLRAHCRAVGAGDPLLVAVEAGFAGEIVDPVQIGFDAAMEFQPNWPSLGEPAEEHLPMRVYDYGVLAGTATDEPVGWPRYRCVTPRWDNSPRRAENPVIFTGSTPERYARWLRDVAAKGDDGELVFVNAWNEWGEGAHLEPDVAHGLDYLDAHAAAVAPPLSVPADAARTRLLENRCEFRRLERDARRLLAEGRLDETLDLVAAAAHWAWYDHTGLFASPALEEVTAEIGCRLTSDLGEWSPRAGRRRVLHVLTEAHTLGGHTRLAWRWMANDPESDHQVVLTGQGSIPVPGALQQVAVLLKAETPSERVRELARMMAESDLVVLHIHPFDAVAVAACAQPSRRPPTMFVNHADHVFWLGVSAADALIHLRPAGAALSAARRGVDPSRFVELPHPLEDRQRRGTKDAAKRALGIDPAHVVLLTMASAYKYEGAAGDGFLEMAGEVLAAAPTVHLVAIGPDAGRHAWARLADAAPGRVHLLGQLDDPWPVLEATDVYLDSYPFSSPTSLLETVPLTGAPAVVRSSLGFPPPLQVDDFGAEFAVAETMEAWVSTVLRFVTDEEERSFVGEQTAKLIRETHLGPTWNSWLRLAYRDVRHGAAAAPLPVCEVMLPLDDALLLLHEHGGMCRPLPEVLAAHGARRPGDAVAETPAAIAGAQATEDIHG